jgi:hypothetical protein
MAHARRAEWLSLCLLSNFPHFTPRCASNWPSGGRSVGTRNNLRLLSAGNDTFKYDLGSEDHEGGQDSTVSVFTRDAKGTLRHFYTGHPMMAPRHSGAWHRSAHSYLALHGPHPQRRGSWYASLAYGTILHALP